MYVVPDCCLANLACAISVLSDSATSAPFLISEHFELSQGSCGSVKVSQRVFLNLQGKKKCLELLYLSSFSEKTTSSIPMFANGDSELVLEHTYFIPKPNPVV